MSCAVRLAHGVLWTLCFSVSARCVTSFTAPVDKTVGVAGQKARNEVPWELKDLVTCSQSKDHQERDAFPQVSGLFKAIRQREISACSALNRLQV